MPFRVSRSKSSMNRPKPTFPWKSAHPLLSHDCLYIASSKHHQARELPYPSYPLSLQASHNQPCLRSALRFPTISWTLICPNISRRLRMWCRCMSRPFPIRAPARSSSIQLVLLPSSSFASLSHDYIHTDPSSYR